MLKLVTASVNTLALAPQRLIRSLSVAPDSMLDPVVAVKRGKLRGSVDELFDGSSFYSFKGIPYAQPPVGQLRFRAPLSPQPWQGIRNAIEHADVCIQLTRNGGVQGSEDCLYLNVYSKSLQPSSKMPVMVYIHGGAFLLGSGNDDICGPKFLLQHDVVLVTLNYRLEALGFLCLDTPEVPGNAGMKDQVAAMKWVKNNIDQFGGDPDNITLFGESAGGSSVTYHMMSPMSKELFHKAIVQSGTCIHDWAQGRGNRERAFRAGAHLGKNTNDADELLQFLKGVPATSLTKLAFLTRTPDEQYRLLPTGFTPVREKKLDNVEAFLSEDTIDIMLSKKMCSVPLMIGYNTAESISSFGSRCKKIDIYNKNPFYDVPRELAEKLNQEKMHEMGERIRKFYIGDREYKKSDVKEIIDFLTDLHFAYNTHRFAYFYSNYNAPIYMYRFNLVTELNVAKSLYGIDVKGACHTDELYYIFSTNMTQDNYESNEKLKNYVWKITKLWTDFAKKSKPCPDKDLGISWPQYSPNSKEYLDISEKFTPGRFADRERIEFWNNLYSEVGLPCMTITQE